MPTPKEAIYDAQIRPLMLQVFEICKEHEIAMLASFGLGFDADDEVNETVGTSWYMSEASNPSDCFIEALSIILPPPPHPLLGYGVGGDE